MGIVKKQVNPAVDPDGWLEQGGGHAEQESPPSAGGRLKHKAADNHQIKLMIPQSALQQIDATIDALDKKNGALKPTSRHSWLLQAIQEKLIADKRRLEPKKTR